MYRQSRLLSWVLQNTVFPERLYCMGPNELSRLLRILSKYEIVLFAIFIHGNTWISIIPFLPYFFLVHTSSPTTMKQTTATQRITTPSPTTPSTTTTQRPTTTTQSPPTTAKTTVPSTEGYYFNLILNDHFTSRRSVYT